VSFRIDRGLLRSPRRTAAGTLRVDGVFTRAGVFVYRNPDGSERRELRLPEEVFRKDALASFEGVPVTDDHPPVMVAPSNVKQYARGVTQEGVRQDGDLVVGSLMITDPELIAKVESGKVQLSCGYEVDEDATPGEDPRYGRYDVVQRKIRGNHLAIVDVARAGPEARVRMDAAVRQDEPNTDSLARESFTATTSSSPRGDTMKTPEELQKMVDAAIADAAAQARRADAAEAQVRELQARADKAEGAVAAHASVASELEQARKDLKDSEGLREKAARAEAERDAAIAARRDAEDPKRFADAVKARCALEGDCRSVMGAEFRCDGIEDRDLQVAVLKRLGHQVEKDKSADHVAGLFTSAVKHYRSGEAALSRARDVMVAQRKDAERYDRDSARQRMIDRNRGRAPQESK